MADPPPPTSKDGNGRPRRFVLPAEEDARTTEAIEGFLVGHRPRRRVASPAIVALRGRGSALVRPDPFLALESRLDWLAALAGEEARHARYRRPVVVVLCELRSAAAPVAPRVEAGLVRRFADLLRRETRPTDRIARLGPARFAILLPETTEVGATQLVERLQARTADWSNGTPGVVVGAGWASPRRGETLREAMAKAEARLVGNVPPTDRKPLALDTL